MSREERTQKIESYSKGYSLLTEALKQFPKEMWNYKSSLDRWSIQEILVHLTDSEANAFVRCRRLIAEPGNTVMAYDQSQWAKSLNYNNQNPEDNLQLFKWLRHTTYQLLKTVPEQVWSHSIIHPERGVQTLDNWLDIYSSHVQSHIKQMQKNYQIWKEKKEAGKS